MHLLLKNEIMILHTPSKYQDSAALYLREGDTDVPFFTRQALINGLISINSLLTLVNIEFSFYIDFVTI